MSYPGSPPADLRVAVVGASGYTGAELLRLLDGHPALAPTIVTADSNAGARIADLYPSLAPAMGERRYTVADPDEIAGCDLVFCALPHGESQKLLPELLDRVGHVVDLGADFRLAAPTYEQWYGSAHGCPELLDRFAYGLVEIFRDQIKAARHVAVPGCYPTAVALALAPFVAAGLVEPGSIIADCASGVSGAGRALKATSLFGEVDSNYAAYALLDHRHTPEMELALAHVVGGSATVLFTPHLAPMSRGILATCYARPASAGLTTAKLLECAREFYASEPFVVVTDQPSGTKATLGSNSVHVTARFDARTGTVIALGALDNLVKGASGQALQCANVLYGFPETTGLPTIGLAP